jgi:hypothetical protein
MERLLYDISLRIATAKAHRNLIHLRIQYVYCQEPAQYTTKHEQIDIYFFNTYFRLIQGVYKRMVRFQKFIKGLHSAN